MPDERHLLHGQCVSDETITVTVNALDAVVLVLGPLEYSVRVSKGELPREGSPMRVRQALAKALRDAGVEL